MTPFTVERTVYGPPTIKTTVIRKLEDWRSVTIESSTGPTPEWIAFARMYRAHIARDATRHGLDLVSWRRGHFDASAFFKNRTTGRLAYLSISDVRFFRNECMENILLRTAAHDKDYTGGPNCWTTLDTLSETLERLTTQEGTP